MLFTFGKLKHLRCLHITLMEVMLVLAILASVTGAIGWGLANVVREQRFRQEVDLIVDKIRLAQDLMLIFNSREVFLRIREAEDGQGITYKLEFDERLLPKALAQELLRPHPKLKYIHYINLLGDDPTIYGTLDLHFFSGGDVMSRGVIHLASARPGSQGAFERYIYLPGYPAPIVSSTENPGIVDKLDKQKAFNAQLTSQIQAVVAPEEEKANVPNS